AGGMAPAATRAGSDRAPFLASAADSGAAQPDSVAADSLARAGRAAPADSLARPREAARPDSTASPRIVREFPVFEVRSLLHDLRSSQTVHEIPTPALRAYPVDDLAGIVALQPGVVAQGQ